MSEGDSLNAFQSLKKAFKALKEIDFFMSKSTEENLILPSMNCVEIDGVWFSESHIGCEFEELKGQLIESLEKYQNVAFTEDQIKLAKNNQRVYITG